MEYLKLSDYVQSAPDTLSKGVAQQLRNESVLLDNLNFLTTGTLSVRNLRETFDENDIPWNEINEELGSVAHGKPEEIQASGFSFGSSIKVDHKLVEDKSPRTYDPRERQTTITVRKMARQFSDVIINNTAALNPKAPIGLKSFIDLYLPSQKVIADAGGLDLALTAPTYAINNHKFWRMLDRAKMMVDGGATHILCNDTFIRCAKALARESTLLTTSKDALGRDITEYDGMKFINVGVKDRKTEAKIITDNEKDDGTQGSVSDKFTSIYLLRMGPDHFQPWQMKALEVTDHGRLKGSVFYQTDIEWVVGYLVTDTKSIARVHGLKME